MEIKSTSVTAIQSWVAKHARQAKRLNDEDLYKSGVETLNHFGIPYLVFRKDEAPVPQSWVEKSKLVGDFNVFASDVFVFVELARQRFLVVEHCGEEAMIVAPSYFFDFR